MGHIVNGGGDCCPGAIDLRVDRTTEYGNFFPMLGREELRDPVCDAFEELASDPIAADVAAIAARHGVTVDARFSSASALTDLAVALDSLEMQVRAGQSRRLLCHCWPARCHADPIIKIIEQRLRNGPMDMRDGGAVCMACDEADECDGTSGGSGGARSGVDMDVGMDDGGDGTLGGATSSGDGSMGMAAAAGMSAADAAHLGMHEDGVRAYGAGGSGDGMGISAAAATGGDAGGGDAGAGGGEPPNGRRASAWAGAVANVRTTRNTKVDECHRSSTVRAQSRLLCHGAYPTVCSGQGSSDFLKLHDSEAAHSGHGGESRMTCDDSKGPQQPQQRTQHRSS